MRLTENEHDILESVERGDWRRMTGLAEEKGRFEVAARATLRKYKRVNVRMSERDHVRFQKKALEEGLPYQTLISSVLHKYINQHEG